MGLENYRAVRNTVDIVIMTTSDKESYNKRKVPDKNIQVILVKRDEEPYKDTWTLPGGFVGFDTTLSKTVETKLVEKTGISGIYYEQLYTYGDTIDRDPRDRVITIGYIALTPKDKINLKNTHGSKETDWFTVETHRNKYGIVESVEFIRESTEERIVTLGFDHNSIIIDAINRVANKLMYTDVGFNLLEEEFTIKELQLSYEAIMGRNIPGFRRIIENKIKETGRSTKDTKDLPELHRPSKLYTKI